MTRRADVGKIIEQAKTCFAQISSSADALAVPEAQGVRSHQLKQHADRWRRHATEASANLNSIAPFIKAERMELLRNTNLMLGEIIHAQTPELAAERFHARRDEIESGLIRLGS